MKTKYLTKAIRCPDGSRKYIRGRTQKELDQKVAKARAELGMGLNINDGTTVLELAQIWVDTYKRPHVKPQSLELTLGFLNAYIIPVIGGMRVRDVKPADCARIMATASSLANGSQRRILGMLRTLFSLAIENRIIAYSPVSSNLKASGAKPKDQEPLTRKQLDVLLRVAQRSEKPWVYTFLLLVSHTGLRLGEALGLQWDCVDLKAKQILVRRQLLDDWQLSEVLKTSSSYRAVPIPPVLNSHLSFIKVRAKSSSVVDTGTKWPHVAVRRALSALPAKAGLDLSLHPHLLRHTFATFCFEAGLDVKDVQYLLGHSDLKMTTEVYIHYRQSIRQGDTARKLADVFSTPTLVAL